MSYVIRDSHRMKRKIAADFARKAAPVLVVGALVGAPTLDKYIDSLPKSDQNFDKVRSYLEKKGCDVTAYDRGEDVICDIE